MKAILPEVMWSPLYHACHVRYFGNLLAKEGYDVEYTGKGGSDFCDMSLYRVELDGELILVDYSDFADVGLCSLGPVPTFKYHYAANAQQYGHVHPFTPVSFHDWHAYEALRQSITYANGDLVCSNQTARRNGDNFERRLGLQRKLVDAFGVKASTRHMEQEAYWRQVGDALIHVFAPGARNNMVDRGHLQYMALGCCTMSPLLVDYFPWYRTLKPWIHFIPCMPDYSDVVDLVRWCQTHRDTCKAVGAAAKRFFEETSTPRRLVEWIRQCLNKIR